jgi:hypothetical protein
MSMTLDELIGAAPRFHMDRGRPWSWALSEDALRFIGQHVTRESRTLETGEGVSTVLFATKGCQHTCVSPDRKVIDRIVRFCENNQIALDRVIFSNSRSQDFLPGLLGAVDRISALAKGGSGVPLIDEHPALDLVLIDGGHEFPVPFIDWYYTTFMLKVGGILVLDDTQLRTCAILKEFLLEEPEWRWMKQDRDRWVAFEKVAEGHSKPWTDQKFMRGWKAP